MISRKKPYTGGPLIIMLLKLESSLSSSKIEYYSKNNGMDPPVRIIDRRAQVCRHFKAHPMIETSKRPSSLKKQGLLPALLR